MPLYFLIDGSSKPISDVAQAEASILKVVNPRINRWQEEKTSSVGQVALIDTGEALYLSGVNERYSFTASLGTSSCLQAFFYNDAKESCLLHFNSDFQINWNQIFYCFKDKTLKFNLVGAMYTDDPTAQPNLKSPRNITAFFGTLIGFLNTNQFSLTLVKQLVLSDNLKIGKDQRGQHFYVRYDPKLSNPGFDACGKIYDMDPTTKFLKSYPMGENIRNVRKHEGEHRAFLARQFKKEFIKPELLLLTAKTSSKELMFQSYIHQAVIDFIHHLFTSGNILTYCETACLFLGKGKPTEPLAIDYTNELKEFIAAVLAFSASQELNELKQMLRKHPKGPFSPTIRSCNYDESYADEAPKFLQELFKQASLLKKQLF